MNYKEIFETELKKNNLSWCQGQCKEYGSHKRGFVFWKDPVIHLDSSISTRNSLYRGLHEIGHKITGNKGRRFEREQNADNWAINTMKQYNIPIPRKARQGVKRYIKRMKRWGDNIQARGQ